MRNLLLLLLVSLIASATLVLTSMEDPGSDSTGLDIYSLSPLVIALLLMGSAFAFAVRIENASIQAKAMSSVALTGTALTFTMRLLYDSSEPTRSTAVITVDAIFLTVSLLGLLVIPVLLVKELRSLED